MKILPALIISLIWSTLPVPAFAEVMDKEPSLLEVWIWCLVGNLLIFISMRIGIWVLVITLPIIGLFFLSLVNEVRDPFAGPAILREAGNAYVLSAYFAPAIVLLSLVIMLSLSWKGKMQKSKKSCL